MYITDRLGKFQENLNEHRFDLNEAVTNFGKRTDDIQSETVWRIKDCEELLRSRVSDKYVNDMVKSLEDKISKQMTFSEEKEIERLEKSFKELTAKTVQLN